MEKLTNISEKMRCGRRMNRRPHSILFRKTQFYIAYKSMELGLKTRLRRARYVAESVSLVGTSINAKYAASKRIGI